MSRTTLSILFDCAPCLCSIIIPVLVPLPMSLPVALMTQRDPRSARGLAFRTSGWAFRYAWMLHRNHAKNIQARLAVGP